MAAGPTVEVTCVVDMEQTHDSLHAFAVPEDIDLQPGDVVLVHDAPSYVPFGERLVRECRATVTRAGPFGRFWAKVCGMFQLTELYEVGFSSREETR